LMLNIEHIKQAHHALRDVVRHTPLVHSKTFSRAC
jgi:threonine dehydratase